MATAAAHPQVTVLLPVRNGSTHLSAALESIFAQTFTNFELLVIDDGSTDATPEILRAIRDPRLRVVTNPRNIGLVPVLNHGLELARGEFVARQDHDDVSLPERLRKQVDFLSAHPAHVLVGAEAIQTDADGRKAFRLLRPRGAKEIRWFLCFDNAFIHSSVMFRREVVRQEFGGYMPSFHSEDYALWSCIARTRETANLAEPLLLFREHDSSVTRSMTPADAAAFEEATTKIRWENMSALFGGQARMEDARFLSLYRREFDAGAAQRFLALFDRLVAEYGRTIQAADGFRQARAMQLAELAYRLLPVARWKALAAYRRAVSLDPTIARSLPWLRLFGLFLLGDGARSLYRTILGRR